jgi:hypothetical protein
MRCVLCGKAEKQDKPWKICKACSVTYVKGNIKDSIRRHLFIIRLLSLRGDDFDERPGEKLL